MLNTPFSPWPSFTEEEATAVHNVLLSNKVNYWTGQEGREFEKEFAVWADSEYAVALSNGTQALDLALKCLGVGEGDEVVVTARTFLASASSIVTAGAIPVFADVDRDNQNVTVDTIRAVLTDKTKAIICVHLAGWSCDMDPIMALAKERGLFVIEDCAQAHGARYKGRAVGSIGHVGAWSFCQDKIMTTGGEGGMVTTNDRELSQRMWSYKDHGKSWEFAASTLQFGYPSYPLMWCMRITSATYRCALISWRKVGRVIALSRLLRTRACLASKGLALRFIWKRRLMIRAGGRLSGCPLRVSWVKPA